MSNLDGRKYDIDDIEGVWVVMESPDGIYHGANAFIECNNRNFVRGFALNHAGRTGRYLTPKFHMEQHVRVARVLPNTESVLREFLDFEGVVEGIEDLPNGDFNYEVSGRYLNEYMLEPVHVKEETLTTKPIRDVSFEEPA